MKSTILIKIKWLNRCFNVFILYFVCYNTYFGWNKKPLSDLETTFDDVLKIGIYLIIGFILNIILSYIKFKMDKYSNDLRKALKKAPDTRKMYESACNEYVQKFCDKQDLTHEGWIKNDVGDIAMCSELVFNMRDIVFDMNSNQPRFKILDWYSKCLTHKSISYQNYIKMSKNQPKNWMNEIAGKWPNKTSDEEFNDLLKEI